MKVKQLILYITLSLLASTSSVISTALAIDFPDKPPTSDFFVDQANLINSEDKKQINQITAALLKEEKIPIIIVTIESLLQYNAAHMSIESYAYELFNHWGIGSQNRNYGMLLLVSKGDRKARIELGAAWGRNHDDSANEIMQKLIIPQFKSGNFSGGILGGVRGLDALARGLALPKPKTPWWALPVMLGGLGLIIFVIISLFKNGQKGWGWALIAFLGVAIFFILRTAASSSGSGGAFGGGSSGGGGASGSW